MRYFTLFIIVTLFSFPLFTYAFPIPDNNEVSFDVIRKNKIIGNIVTKFTKEEQMVKIHTVMDIKVKVLFIPAYKFFQETTETWKENELIEVIGFTDFEDEREYHIKGKDIDDKFIASGMDGELELDKSIITLNYWNKNILNQKELFDTQKGIVREIKVKKLKNEIIEINNKKIETEKYIFNAKKNPKDLGPCIAIISTFGSKIFTSNLFPDASPFAKKITSESAIEIHHLSSANLSITGSLIKFPLSSIIGQ